MRFSRTPIVLLAWLLFMPALWAGGWSDDPAIEARVESLLKQMTLEEKLGQLSQYSGNMPTGPGTGRRNY